MMGKHLIFVYGTLKRGWGNNDIISDQEFISEAHTVYRNYQMYMLSHGGFPGVVKGRNFISGELFSVDDAAFARCDQLEGHPNFYKREEVDIMGKGGEFIRAWIYIYQGDVSGRKPIDNWTR